MAHFEDIRAEPAVEPTPLFVRLRQALLEDLGPLDACGDVTGNALVPPDKRATGFLKAKQAGVLCGARLLPLLFGMADEFVSASARAVADELDGRIEAARATGGDWRAVEQMAARGDPDGVKVEVLKKDGAFLAEGDRIARVDGRARALLFGERTALNLVARLCGIATLTRRYVEAAANTAVEILDTRKTTPLWRDLEKYAVKTGGGRNHRNGLYDMVLIKDNHLALWGCADSAAAVRLARERAPACPVEIEVVDLPALQAVLKNSVPDFVLLDNFSVAEVTDAVAWCRKFFEGRSRRPKLEASGGITLDTVAAYAATGVDRISVGALTHAAPALDLSMDLVLD